MEYVQTAHTNNTAPHLYSDTPLGSAFLAGNAVVAQKDLYSAPDNRYPAYSAALEDGRMVTDYRPQCSKNVRPGYQFETKKWMIQNAERIMDETRKRQMEWSGAALPMANTVPPPAGIVESTPFYSELQPTYLKNGIGIQRADSRAPDLFGTFYYASSMVEQQMNRKKIGITNVYEGGRNTLRR